MTAKKLTKEEEQVVQDEADATERAKASESKKAKVPDGFDQLPFQTQQLMTGK